MRLTSSGSQVGEYEAGTMDSAGESLETRIQLENGWMVAIRESLACRPNLLIWFSRLEASPLS